MQVGTRNILGKIGGSYYFACLYMHFVRLDEWPLSEFMIIKTVLFKLVKSIILLTLEINCVHDKHQRMNLLNVIFIKTNTKETFKPTVQEISILCKRYQSLLSLLDDTYLHLMAYLYTPDLLINTVNSVQIFSFVYRHL